MAIDQSKSLLASTLFFAMLLAAANRAFAHNCSCNDPKLCCSKTGLCGASLDYCGSGCQSGPCSKEWPRIGVSVLNIVTDEFFKRISDQATSNCSGKGFYTRRAFLQASRWYPNFGTVKSTDDSRREVAAFFAHVNLETIKMCYIEEINGTKRDYCDEKDTRYPCESTKGYYGRGPIQLSWNFNYGPAGESIGFDGLKHPEIVASNAVIAFRTALWYWMSYCHVPFLSGKGFGSTIRAVNGELECDGANTNTVSHRVKYYKKFCKQLRVDPGKNLTC